MQYILLEEFHEQCFINHSVSSGKGIRHFNAMDVKLVKVESNEMGVVWATLFNSFIILKGTMSVVLFEDMFMSTFLLHPLGRF